MHKIQNIKVSSVSDQGRLHLSELVVETLRTTQFFRYPVLQVTYHN